MHFQTLSLSLNLLIFFVSLNHSHIKSIQIQKSDATHTHTYTTHHQQHFFLPGGGIQKVINRILLFFSACLSKSVKLFQWQNAPTNPFNWYVYSSPSPIPQPSLKSNYPQNIKCHKVTPLYRSRRSHFPWPTTTTTTTHATTKTTKRRKNHHHILLILLLIIQITRTTLLQS